MIYIDKSCYHNIIKFFSNCNVEKCGIIGTSDRLNHITDFCPVNTINSSADYLLFDNNDMKNKIDKWADNNICFCGIIHSHIGECDVFSKEDIALIRDVLICYNHLSETLFPIVTVNSNLTKITYYKCTLKESKPDIKIENDFLIIRGGK